MRGTASVCTVAVATAEGSEMSGEQTSREACPRPADVADGRAGEKSETRDSRQSRTESRNPTSLSTPSCSPMTGCSETDRHRLPKWLAMKWCGHCGRTLPETEFTRDRSRKDGLDCYCRVCRKESNMRYTKAGRERHAERMRTDREYRERVLSYYRKYNAKHKENG